MGKTAIEEVVEWLPEHGFQEADVLCGYGIRIITTGGETKVVLTLADLRLAADCIAFVRELRGWNASPSDSERKLSHNLSFAIDTLAARIKEAE